MNPRVRRALLLAVPVAALSFGAARKAPPWEKPNQLARNLFLENCSICHELVKLKSPKLGPSLVRFKKVPAERAEPFRQYIMIKIRSGGIKMPAFGSTLTDDQIRRLAMYLLPEP
jgi:mono/diheme cytochrome c family protein